MKACLDSKKGLRSNSHMSQVFAFQTERSRGIKILSDAAINIKPTVDQKISIIKGVVPLARVLGSPRPAVALICALEKPNPKMPCTLDAAKVADHKALWDELECDVDGPLAMDCAVDPEAARIKKLTGPVPGNADILIFPDLASANIFAKGICLLGGADSGAIVLGGRAPIVMRSRSDTIREKTNSILLGLLAAHKLF